MSMEIQAASLKEKIRRIAFEHGFDAAGFTAPIISEKEKADLDSYIATGNYGDMDWMAERTEMRKNPLHLWQEVKTILCLGLNYAPAHNPLDALADKQNGVISVYAQSNDYHDIIKQKMKALAAAIQYAAGGEAKIFVDTAPVMEKPLAARAGIGWQGKHTCVVSRQFGSWLFLGEIFLTIKLAPDAPHRPSCGSCQACMDICPTRAIPAPYQLDVKRCIAYLTIEHKGEIGPALWPLIGNRIYGCDDCLAVCPWNKFASITREAGLQPRPEMEQPSLAFLLTLDDAGFRKFFSKSPVKRTGRNRFIRNVLIAATNSGDRTLLPQVQKLTYDSSPLVSSTAKQAAMLLSL